MSKQITIWTALWLLLVLSGPLARAGSPAPAVPAELQKLAAQASKKATWPALRAYAKAAPKVESRGLAWWLLGYQEYAAGDYQAALNDLRTAAGMEFSLTALARYYWALAAKQANQPEQVIVATEGFPARFPQNPYRFDALAMLCQALLETGQTERAVQLLTAEPSTRQRPPLALLLAQAYEKLPEKQLDAAFIYQEIYYAYPGAEEEDVATTSLRRLTALLGAAMPTPSEQIRTSRADILYNTQAYAHALAEYEALRAANPRSELVGRWAVAKGRCLLRLRQPGEAVKALQETFSDPEVEAARLALLVEAYLRLQDETQALQAFQQLRETNPRSPANADALFELGAFYGLQGDWNKAAAYYRPLAEEFPTAELAPLAYWRVGWNHYLRQEWDAAQAAFLDHARRYPNSLHLPSIAYWLGRIAQRQGRPTEARGFFTLLQERYVNHYFAQQARKRLRELATINPAPDPSGESPALQTLLSSITAISPPVRPCEVLPRTEPVRTFSILTALQLDRLADEYLRAVMDDAPKAPELLLTLSRHLAKKGMPAEALFAARALAPELARHHLRDLPQEVWQLLYPRAHATLIRSQAGVHKLDPHLLMGLIRQESAFNPRATSRANARGLMQVLPSTARSVLRSQHRRIAAELYDPAFNVRVGTRYLGGLLTMFKGNIEHALAAYNAGENRVSTWLSQREFNEPAEFVETIPFRETRFYVQLVLRDAEIYRQLLSEKPPFAKCQKSVAY